MIEQEAISGGDGGASFPKDKVVKIKIISAHALRNADQPSEGVSDPYCCVEIAGNPSTRVKTPVCQDSLNPEWNFDVVMPTYQPGDNLMFTLFDKDVMKFDDHLGRAQLSSARIGGGNFTGELPLAGDGAAGGSYLKVSVSLVPRPKPKVKAKPKAKAAEVLTIPDKPEEEAPREYKVQLTRKAPGGLGGELDMTDGITCAVVAVNNGHFKTYNESAAGPDQIIAGDHILEVNGSRNISEMFKHLKESLTLDMTLCHIGVSYTIQINKLEWESLGMTFNFFDGGGESAVVKSIGSGPVNEWNKDNPDRAVEVGDRMVSVNGQRGGGQQLLEFIKEADEELDLAFFKPTRPQPKEE